MPLLSNLLAVRARSTYVRLVFDRWRAGAALPRARHAAVAVALSVLLLPAGLQLHTLATILRQRIAFPMDLEWMESGHLYHAYRLSHHLPLYADPARGFAAFPYPPLYWCVVAGLGQVFGLDYWTGRALSIASIAGCAVIFGVLLVRRAPQRVIGLAFALSAAASIGAGYPIAAGSFDLARTDSFATFVAVVAALLVGEGRLSSVRLFAAALALTAAVYTKQTGVFFALWLLVFARSRDRRSGLRLAAATGVGSAVLLGAMCVFTDGWFWVWLVDMRHHAILLRSFADPLGEFLRHAPFLVLVPPLALLLHRRGWLRPDSVKWLGMLAAAIAGAMLAHVKAGGWVNLYIPVLVLAWPVSLLVVCDLLRGLKSERATVTTWGVLCALSALLLVSRYDAARFVPTPRMWSGVDRFHRTITELDGEVVVATVPFAAIRDGKRCSQPILQAYFDAANAGMKVRFVDGLDVSGARWVIVTGTWLEEHLGDELEPKFELVRQLDVELDSPGVQHPFPRTLWRRRVVPTDRE